MPTKTPLAPHAARRPDIENYLESKMVKWTFYPAINLGDVDVSASHRNQARARNAILPRLVEKYSVAIKNGELNNFPALVGYLGQGKRIVLMDGNNRYEAFAKNNVSSFAFYIVEAEPEMIQVMTYEFNRMNGEPPSREDMELQGIHLIDSGMTVEAAASVVGLTKSALGSVWLKEQADRRARLLRIQGWDRLSIASKRVLKTISTDPAFVAMAKLAIASKMSSSEVASAVRQINEARDQEAQLQIVEELKPAIRAAVQKRGGAVQSPFHKNPRAMVLAHLGYLEKADPAEIVRACLVPEQRDEIAKMCYVVADRLLVLAESISGES